MNFLKNEFVIIVTEKCLQQEIIPMRVCVLPPSVMNVRGRIPDQSNLVYI